MALQWRKLWVLCCLSIIEDSLAGMTAPSKFLDTRTQNDTVRLQIAPRRQWDCKYRGRSCSPMKVSGPANSSSIGHELSNGSAPTDGQSQHGQCHCGESQCHEQGRCDCRMAPQSHVCDGYCGSTSAQEAFLWFGAYVTLGVMRELIDPSNLYDMLICADSGPDRDLETLVKFLGFDATPLCDNISSPASYVSFISYNLKKGYPVILGVWVRGSGNQNESGYEHIVLVVGREGNEWLINDGYQPMVHMLSTIPRSKAACDEDSEQNYCATATASGESLPYALAVLPPQDLCPARLQIAGCTDGNGTQCKLSGPGQPNGWVEPNWGIEGFTPVTYIFSAKPADSFCKLQAGKRYVVVKTLVISGPSKNPASSLRTVVRSYGSPFNAPATQCFDWPPGSTSLSIGEASSRDAIFVRFVEQGSQGHADARCPE